MGIPGERVLSPGRQPFLSLCIPGPHCPLPFLLLQLSEELEQAVENLEQDKAPAVRVHGPGVFPGKRLQEGREAMGFEALNI